MNSRKTAWIGAVVVLSLALSACSSRGPYALAPGITQLEGMEMPMPEVSYVTAADRPYLVGAFDTLNVAVFGVPELTGEIQTDASGQFGFPLIGAVQASGKTPMDIAREIEARLAESYVRDPAVTVNVVESTSNVMTVGGQVGRPGQYPVLGRMTLLRAVSIAGGMGEFARQDEVILLREAADQRYIGVYDLSAITNGNYADPEIFANDIIIVGDSPQLRAVGRISSLMQLINIPLLFITRL